jgi:Mg2+ and Co2+ transporter CorA
MSVRPKRSKDSTNQVLPRSLYIPKSDPRAEIRETVNVVFSDRFMIFLSIIVIPLILIPFLFELDVTVLSFLNICDWIIIVLFVAEYITKLYVAENRWSHFKSPWHLVDLVIIVLPFLQYLVIAESISGSPSLLLRLLRVPRVLVVGGRAVAGRRMGPSTASTLETAGPDVVIRQVDSNLQVKPNLTWAEFKAHIKDEEFQEWLDLYNISDEGFTQLSEILRIPEPHFKSRLVDDIYPHINYVQKASFIFLQKSKVKYPDQDDSLLTISRSGIIVICSGTKVITVSKHSVDLLAPVLASVQQSKKGAGFVVPVLYGILEHMLDDYRSILSELEYEVMLISGTPRSKLPKDFLDRVFQLDKEISRLVSNLMHFKDMLSLTISKKLSLQGFDKTSEESFQVLQESAEYLNEMSHDLIDNLRSIIDLYINQTSFEANKILKILAVITAISVIPSAVSGILGTNLLDVPYGATLWQLSFIITVSMSFIAYTFIKLGWLKT